MQSFRTAALFVGIYYIKSVNLLFDSFLSHKEVTNIYYVFAEEDSKVSQNVQFLWNKEVEKNKKIFICVPTVVLSFVRFNSYYCFRLENPYFCTFFIDYLYVMKKFIAHLFYYTFIL